MATSTLSCTIMTPDAVVWEGAVTEVAAQNSDGPFSVLPDHARFLTIITGEPITLYHADGTEASYTYDEAVLVVEDNTITVFVHTDSTQSPKQHLT